MENILKGTNAYIGIFIIIKIYLFICVDGLYILVTK